MTRFVESPMVSARRILVNKFWLLVLTVALAAQAPTIYEQSATLLQRGESGKAIELLEPHLKQAPGDLRALTLMGMALSSQDRRDQGNEYFRRALLVNPSFAPALRNLAINEMASGSTANARKYLEELLKLAPRDPVGRLGFAELEFYAGHYESAIANYEQSGDLYLRDPANLIRYAQACIELKQPGKARAALDKMPQGADAQAHFSAGGLLAKLEQYPAAVREFELALNGYPNAYDAAFNLMLARVKAGQFDAAVRTGEELVAKGDRHAELYNLLAQAYEQTGKTKEAYEALRTATTLEPSAPSNYLDLIALCIAHKNYDLALEIADLSVTRLPKADQLHLQRGIVLAMKEDFDGAKTAFESAIKIDSNRSVSQVALALMLLQMDRPTEAADLLRKHSKKTRDYLTLWFLGEALIRGGATEGSAEHREAASALSLSVNLKADVPQSRILLAKLLARDRQFEAAEKHLTRALELDPENVTATYQLAQILQRKGEAARAKELFAKVSKAKAEDREQFTKGGLQHIIRVGAK